jgi:Ca2+/Na+ antiporter
MENLIETPNNFGDDLIAFLEKFLNIFIVDGVSIEIQQSVKVLILIVSLLFIVILASVLVSIISKLLKPVIESMAGQPQYMFYTILSILVFSFTGDISFGNVLTAVVILSLLILAYQYIIKPKPNTEKEKVEDNQQNW